MKVKREQKFSPFSFTRIWTEKHGKIDYFVNNDQHRQGTNQANGATGIGLNKSQNDWKFTENAK